MRDKAIQIILYEEERGQMDGKVNRTLKIHRSTLWWVVCPTESTRRPETEMDETCLIKGSRTPSVDDSRNL